MVELSDVLVGYLWDDGCLFDDYWYILDELILLLFLLGDCIRWISCNFCDFNFWIKRYNFLMSKRLF